MKNIIDNLPYNSNLTIIDNLNDFFNERPVCPEEKIFKVITSFIHKYSDELILYGGQCSVKNIYGFKNIRSPSTDIDFVIKDGSLENIVSNEKLYFVKDFDILVMHAEGVPVTFTYKHIHNWRIDKGFYKNIVKVKYGDVFINCCSREYLLMLKIRRLKSCCDLKTKLFGKDALDIINILTAPFIRTDLNNIDLKFTGDLILKYVTGDKNILNYIFNFIYIHKHHLIYEDERKFIKVFDELKNLITGG